MLRPVTTKQRRLILLLYWSQAFAYGLNNISTRPNAKSYGYATAGWIAAPVIAKIVEETAPILGLIQAPVTLPPQDTIDQLIESIP